MYPQGVDCLNRTILTECQTLIGSKTRFQAYPNDRRLRLALVRGVASLSPSPSPLRLTLLHGECASVICEGGIPSQCRNHKRGFTWHDVGRAHDFPDCTPNHYYCATAAIGDCCSICTETIFLPDLPPLLHSTQDQDQDSQPLWSESPHSLAAVAALFLIVTITLAAVSFKLLSGYRSRVMRSYTEVQSPKSQHIAFPPLKTCNEATNNVKAIVVYVKEDGVSFNYDVASLQSFLWNRRIHVKDVYNEEEHIAESIKIWVRKIMQDKDTKIVLIETELLRSFINSDRAQIETSRLVGKAVIYLLSCIPMVNQYNKIFVVRKVSKKTEDVQEAEDDGSSNIFSPGNGRIYSYPTNKERLAQDLLVHGRKTQCILPSASWYLKA